MKKARLKIIAILGLAGALGLLAVSLVKHSRTDRSSATPSQGATQTGLADREDPDRPAGRKTARVDENVPVDMRALSGEERKQVIAGFDALKKFARGIEFKNSKLRWLRELEDRSIQVHELSPPSKEDLEAAQREIDGIIADQRMSATVRRAFAHFTSEALGSYLVPEGQRGCLFIQVPRDRAKDIFVSHSVGTPDIDRLVEELESSNGSDASFGGGGEGTITSAKRTEPGWRYEKFLMIGEDDGKR